MTPEAVVDPTGCGDAFRAGLLYGVAAGVAPVAGAVLGGTVGSGVGRGRGSAAGAAVGTVIGGILGEAAALEATQPGYEITVRLDDWTMVVVRQPKTGGSFQPGDHVRVVGDGQAARVTK